MSDTQERVRTGSAADRAPIKAIGSTAVGSGAVGLLVATADWANDMVQTGHYIVPSNALMVMWATTLAPIVGLIYHIYFTKLQQKAEQQ